MAKHKSDLIDSLDDFTRAYIECALWSSTDMNADGDMGDSLETEYSVDDIALPTLREIIRECREFQKYHSATYAADWTDEQAGYDFWLTRNGHGAGFWDRGHAAGDELSAASKPYGSVDLYVSRGKVHAS